MLNPPVSGRTLCLVCWLVLIPPTVKSIEADSGPPNIVFILADDCTFRDIGCYGGQAQTPNIDRLATEGKRFLRCFQAAPMCSPTRHNIYTGLYPVKSGAYPNHTYVKPGVKSIVHYLKPLGYRVALSGKTHIAPRKSFPFEYSGKKNPDMESIDQLMRECKSTATPFCLFACSNEPHSPWDKGDASRYPPDKVKLPPYIADTPLVRDSFSRYLAEITYFDSQVGQIDALLKKHGLRDRTVLVVASEQGNSFPFAKWTCYGNGLQSALIVRWPGMVKPGSQSSALVEYVDFLPTFVEVAGGKPNPRLDGKSLLPVLLDQTDQHKSHVFGIMTTRGIINGSDVYPIRTVRDDRYRLIWNLNPSATFTNALTKSPMFESMNQLALSGDPTAKWVVANYQHRPEWELYDCQQDPLEMKNLADDPRYESVRNRLQQKLDAWMKSQGDRGIQTEIDAALRLQKNSGKSREQALQAWKRQHDKASKRPDTKERQKKRGGKNRSPNK